MSPESPTRRQWVVPAEAVGARLDQHVASTLDLPRSRVQGWIKAQLVSLDQHPARVSTRLRGGEVVVVVPPPAVPDDRVVAAAGEIGVVLGLDEDVILLDKPAGLVVHPGAGRRSGTLVNALLARFPEIAGLGGPGRPGIVHRLDRDTSGVMVVARSERAYRALSEAFAARRVAKVYLALLWGPVPAAFERRDPIARHPTDRVRMAVRPGGRAAVSHFFPLATASAVVACAVVIETGRTHQIRVHAKAAKHPLVGDPLYGEARHRGQPRGRAQAALVAFSRPALHAWSLSFEHPGSGEPVHQIAPVPADLNELWASLGGSPLESLLERWAAAGSKERE